MIKLAGMVLIVGAGAWSGICAAKKIEYRETLLRSLVESLELLEWELSFRLPLLKELFYELARKTTGPVSKFYAACGRKTVATECPITEIWEQSAREELSGLKDSDYDALFALGAVLGRYDAESQKSSVLAVRERLNGSLREAAEEKKQKGRVYSTLGAAAGIFVGILLL